MSDAVRFERNLGFLAHAEQDQIENSVVAVAGAGGDGGMLAVQLARMGVGELRLADPDPFEAENINRQAVCNEETIGVNKAEAVAGYVSRINPDIRTAIYTGGITKDNVSEFVAGADLVIDETEFTLHALAVMLAREARANDIPNMTALNVGFGTLATTYHPKGSRLETRLGFREEQDIDEIAATEVSLDRWLPYLPPYGDLKVFELIAKGEKSAPSIAPGVAMAAAVGATQAMLNLVRGIDNHRPKPVYAPRAIVFDAMTLRADVIGYTRRSHYVHLAKMVGRNLLKRNPHAGYAEA